jgi:hypothetical protein
MNAPAIIQADFADFRQVKSRKVAQLICEVPLEALPHVMAVLGWPKPETSLPVAIARLQDPGPDRQDTVSDLPIKSSKHWDDMSPVQQAGIRAQDPAFQEWVGVIPELRSTPSGEDIARKHIHATCMIQSRRDLMTDAKAAARWKAMDTSFTVRGYR